MERHDTTLIQVFETLDAEIKLNNGNKINKTKSTNRKNVIDK